jgi:hypothetical protein
VCRPFFVPLRGEKRSTLGKVHRVHMAGRQTEKSVAAHSFVLKGQGESDGEECGGSGRGSVARRGCRRSTGYFKSPIDETHLIF